MSMLGPLAKFRAVLGLTRTQLTYYWLPAILAICGVAVAVLLMVLLSGMGFGVITAGTEGLAWLEQDLWISAGPLELAPGSVGSVENPLLDAHPTAEQIGARSDIASAGAMSFQSVYVQANHSEFKTLVGVGVAGNTTSINIRQGTGFNSSDRHYANGSYDGPMSHEVIIDERTASVLNLTVGETVKIGGTLSSARRNEFTVVGISPTFSTFLGTATVTIHLSELQTLTGSARTDSASLLTVDVADHADPSAVKSDLEQSYPEFTIRTNREQLESIIGRQSTVLASAIALVVVAIIIGMALVVNVLGLFVYHQRSELLALKATGISTLTLIWMIGGQGIAIGLIGGIIGLIAAPVFVGGLNPLIESLSGFPKLIKLPWWILTAGGSLAFFIGIFGTVVAGWRISQLDLNEQLRR